MSASSRGGPAGLLARQRIEELARGGGVSAAAPIKSGQLQPASLDLRLGVEAFRVRASFLPGRGASVADRLKSLNPERVSLAGDGAVLEKGIVYIAPLMERAYAARRPFRRGQSEEFDRTARHLHPPHR